MFKLVVLSAILAVVASAPSHISPISYTIHEQPSLHKIGAIVENVPTGVSHQSQTIVHSKPVVTPVLQKVVHKTIIAQPAPIIKHIELHEPAHLELHSSAHLIGHHQPSAHLIAHHQPAAHLIAHHQPAHLIAHHQPEIQLIQSPAIGHSGHGLHGW